MSEFEIDATITLALGRDAHQGGIVDRTVAALRDRDVVIRPSRAPVTGCNGRTPRISRTVPTAVIQWILAEHLRRFAFAKGGIACSGVAHTGP